MANAFKGALVLLYLAALLSLLMPFAERLAHGLQLLVAILLLAHIGEMFIFTRHIRLYRGSLAASLLLTLLFGFLHWKPLADAARRSAR